MQSLILVANVYYKAFLRVDQLREILPSNLKHEVKNEENPLIYFTMFHEALDFLENGLSGFSDFNTIDCGKDPSPHDSK